MVATGAQPYPSSLSSALSLEVLRCRLHCACGERAARLEVLRSVLSFSFQCCHFHCDCDLRTTIFDLIQLCTFISFLPLLLAVWSRRARDRILFDWALRFHLISAMAHRKHNASGNVTNRLNAQSRIKSNTVARLAQSPYKSQRKKARHQNESARFN